MRITEEQLERLNRLKCERLSSNELNLRAVDEFFIRRNEALSDVLKSDAYADDEDNRIAYYVVKDEENHMLFYFSLKCGMLYDRFIEGEGLSKIISFYHFLSKLKDAEDVDAEQKKSIAFIQESIRTKKGIKKERIQEMLHGSCAKCIRLSCSCWCKDTNF